MRTGGLFSFIRLHLDVILISLGFILFVVGFFNIIPFPEYKEYGSYYNITFYEIIYSLCFTFSVIFLVAGFALRFELFAETTFEGKCCSMMLCSSLPLLTLAILLYSYREVVAEKPELVVFPAPGHRLEERMLTLLVYNYPYIWLSPILGSIGIGCLLLGLFLKLRG
ncbi:MAG: hypothetical protein QME50_00090 [Candidatus Bathyarchaeota archaeon]|nr:hypothetical protein [Candidatus Bathyarchaeota archaeon]